jgi:hypothetical protein
MPNVTTHPDNSLSENDLLKLGAESSVALHVKCVFLTTLSIAPSNRKPTTTSKGHSLTLRLLKDSVKLVAWNRELYDLVGDSRTGTGSPLHC